jgi:TnpA family transposase
MIEGVLRHCTEMEVERQYTDSHGQSEVAFAFCKLLGFELLPRLKAIHSQRLYRPDNSDHYPQLVPVLSRAINWELISQQYDQVVMYCLSWNWRERSFVKITERTYEKRAQALYR